MVEPLHPQLLAAVVLQAVTAVQLQPPPRVVVVVHLQLPAMMVVVVQLQLAEALMQWTTHCQRGVEAMLPSCKPSADRNGMTIFHLPKAPTQPVARRLHLQPPHVPLAKALALAAHLECQNMARALRQYARQCRDQAWACPLRNLKKLRLRSLQLKHLEVAARLLLHQHHPQEHPLCTARLVRIRCRWTEEAQSLSVQCGGRPEQPKIEAAQSARIV